MMTPNVPCEHHFIEQEDGTGRWVPIGKCFHCQEPTPRLAGLFASTRPFLVGCTEAYAVLDAGELVVPNLGMAD